jgi:hypothetical protein
LIEALRHPDAGTRRGAAASLRALGAWQAVPALQEALDTEGDGLVHAALTAAIQYLDHDIHVEALIKNRDVRGLAKMLSSSRLDDVATACRALGSIGDRQAVEALVMVFRNPMLPDRIRLAAAEALLKLESAPAVVTLLGALRREDWQVRRNAAAVLGQLRATWATEALIRALGDPNPTVRRTVLAALRRIGTSQAMETVNEYESSQRDQDNELSASEPLIPGQEVQIQLPPITIRLDPGAPGASQQPSLHIVAPAEPTILSPEPGAPPAEPRPRTDRILTPPAETPQERARPMVRQLGIAPQLPVSGSTPSPAPGAPPAGGRTAILPPLPDDLPPDAQTRPHPPRDGNED